MHAGCTIMSSSSNAKFNPNTIISWSYRPESVTAVADGYLVGSMSPECDDGALPIDPHAQCGGVHKMTRDGALDTSFANITGLSFVRGVYATPETLLVASQTDGGTVSRYTLNETGATLVKHTFRAFRGTVGTIDVVLVWAGSDSRFGCNAVGTVPSAVSAYASVLAFQPDFVISAGTAGGFGSIAGVVGDVYLSTKCVFHDRRIPEADSSKKNVAAGGRTTYEEYGFGSYRSPSLGGLALAAALKEGVVSTSDSLDCTARDLSLMRSEGASCKDMEAAAVAWTCKQLGVPFVAMKSITDIVDSHTAATEAQFYANLEVASKTLQGKLTTVLELLGGRTLESWGLD